MRIGRSRWLDDALRAQERGADGGNYCTRADSDPASVATAFCRQGKMVLAKVRELVRPEMERLEMPVHAPVVAESGLADVAGNASFASSIKKHT